MPIFMAVMAVAWLLVQAYHTSAGNYSRAAACGATSAVWVVGAILYSHI